MSPRNTRKADGDARGQSGLASSPAVAAAPLKILLDTPSAAPSLGHGGYAAALATIVETSDPRFAVGIFGGWGTGKTTLMQAIERQLGDSSIPVWFNAWRYEKEEHLIVPLLDTVREALVEWADDSSRDPTLKAKAIMAASTAARRRGRSSRQSRSR